LSIKQIENKLKIPRSTLSGWFKHIILSHKQKEILLQRWRFGLIKARRKALQWHNEQKNKRLIKAKNEAELVLKRINLKNKDILDLILAMLYLGEGAKSAEETSMGSSDPLLLKTFVKILRKNYDIDNKKIRCDLYLRADQNIDEIKKFWSRQLQLSLNNFKYVQFDKRTINSKTFPYYKGVCVVRYGNIAIKRKLLNISREVCEKIISLRG
jgi:hypothetical protein